MERSVILSQDASRALLEGLRGAAMRFSRELGWRGRSVYPFSSVMGDAVGCVIPLAEGKGFSIGRPFPDGVVACPLTFDEEKGLLKIDSSFFPKVDFDVNEPFFVESVVDNVFSSLMNEVNVKGLRSVTLDGTLPFTMMRGRDDGMYSYSALFGGEDEGLAAAVKAYNEVRGRNEGSDISKSVSGISMMKQAHSLEPFRYDGLTVREASAFRHDKARIAMTNLTLMMADVAAKRNQSVNGRYAGADVVTGYVDIQYDQSSCALCRNGEVVFCAFLDHDGALVVSDGVDYENRPATPSRVCVVGEKSGSQQNAEDILMNGTIDERMDVMDAIRRHVEGIVLSKESCEAYGEACDRTFEDITGYGPAAHAMAFLAMYYDRQAGERIDTAGLSNVLYDMAREMPLLDMVRDVMQECRAMRPKMSGDYAVEVERRVVSACRGIYDNFEKNIAPGI